MKISDLCKDERPRERLIAKGPSALTNGELLAVILRTGVVGKNAVDVSRTLLAACDGSLVGISRLGIRELGAFDGIGPGKAAMLAACFELSRRFLEESSSPRGLEVCSSDTAYSILKPVFKGLTREECHILLLDSGNRLISRCKLSTGSSRSTIMDPQEVLQLCLEKKAASLIVAHNHPSGDPMPSEADAISTKNLADAAHSCGFHLLDHIIVCDNRYYSFAGEELKES